MCHNWLCHALTTWWCSESCQLSVTHLSNVSIMGPCFFDGGGLIMSATKLGAHFYLDIFLPMCNIIDQTRSWISQKLPSDLTLSRALQAIDSAHYTIVELVTAGMTLGTVSVSIQTSYWAQYLFVPAAVISYSKLLAGQVVPQKVSNGRVALGASLITIHRKSTCS